MRIDTIKLSLLWCHLKCSVRGAEGGLLVSCRDLRQVHAALLGGGAVSVLLGACAAWLPEASLLLVLDGPAVDTRMSDRDKEVLKDYFSKI